MAGHSKWANIKRRKGAVDAARGKIFTRLTREIQVAARSNPDPDANFALRLAIDRARAENMPRDTIDRAVKRGSGQDKDASAVEQIVYEGYGPQGVALLIECLTDNRNRTIAAIRRVFNRAGCALAEPNAVAWQFKRQGLIVIRRQELPEAMTAEDVFMLALEAGAEDIQDEEESLEIYTEGAELAQVAQELQQSGAPFASVEMIMHPQNRMELPTAEALGVLRMVENLEDLDDVNRVFHNLALQDEALAQLAA